MAVRSLADILAYIPQRNQWKLDQEIDFEHKNNKGETVPKDLGRISESMTNWEGTIADNLGLTVTERKDIKESIPSNPNLQR